MNQPLQGYDIIADIHGCADKLQALLEKLGYRFNGNAWCHKERKVIFLGDYIDRGCQILETLQIVRSMHEAGSAVCLMGNHELNAIGWATPHPKIPDTFLRPHTEKNRKQHAQTLEQLGNDYQEWIDWFKSLPLWGEFQLGGQTIHCIHACWSDEAMNALCTYRMDGQSILQGDKAHPTLTQTGFELAFTKGHTVFKNIELLLKGAEINLPDGYFMTDKDGHRRSNMRIQWWREPQGTYQDMAMVSSNDRENIPSIAIEPNAFTAFKVHCPTFIGHYWLTPDQGIKPMDDKIVCLDYSAGKGGPLVAYRINVGDTNFYHDRFASVED